ncbi:MAG: hypothetical protein KBD01_06850 [Acidobacteria bacterium]|nr:hypothetical protein [Acidobacteriota bacterium]
MSPARAWRPWALLVGVPAIAFLLGLFPLWDYDIWGHLAAARLILETGSVPRTDPFLWGADGRPWTDTYWLFQLGVYGLFQLGGASLLVLAKAALAALAVAVAMAARRAGTSVALAALAWLFPLVSLGGRTYERPEMVSVVMLAAFLAVVAHAGQRPRLLWLLPALQVLWVNCHPYFVFGPLIAVLFALDELAGRAVPALARESRGAATSARGRVDVRAGGAVPGGTAAPAPAGWAWMVVAATVLACLVNPYGLRGALFPLDVFVAQGADHLFYRQYIAELRGVWFFVTRIPTNPYVIAFLATFAAGVLAGLAAFARGRLTFFRLALLVLFGVLGWSATRNAGVFALVYATLTTWNLHDVWTARPDAGATASRQVRRRSRGAPAEPARRLEIAALAAHAALAVVVASGALYAWGGEGRTIGLGERAAWYAHAAQRFLTREGMPRRAFVNGINEANLTLFEGRGRTRVYIDPRLEVVPRPLFEEYLDVLRAMGAGDTPRWERFLERPGDAVRWPSILLERARSGAAPEGVARAPGWRPVYADDLAVVFVREEFARTAALPRVDWRE